MIRVATDGSSLANPGPAGWAWVIDEDNWASGGWESATNNVAELTAVLHFLHATADLCEPVEILCDSQYVINSLTKWMPSWKRKGWKKADGKPVANRELMEDLDRAMARRDITFTWVKGHAGNELNEAADSKARSVAEAIKSGDDYDEGPGLVGVLSSDSPDEDRDDRSIENLLVADSPDGDTSICKDDHDDVIGIVTERELELNAVIERSEGYLSYLHPEVIEFGSNGRIWDCEKIAHNLLGREKEAGFELIGSSRLDRHVIQLRWRIETPSAIYLKTSIWTDRDGSWQMIFTQATRVISSSR